MKKNLIFPALLAMGFAGGALPASALAQSQSQNGSDAGPGNAGNQNSGSAYDRYLRQLHDALMRDHASRQDGGGGSQSQSQSHSQQSDREQFLRGYRAGREEERRRREARSSQGGQDQGSQNQSSQNQSRRSSQGSGQGSGQASGQGGERMYVIPNVYPDSAPFQQFAVVPDYSRSMDHLLVAAQSLREAIQDLARQPAGDRRDRAISEMQDALLETQQAMMRIPPAMR
ncbi:hypothetical protein [Falsiroseomonas tokyonensis]|uniref:Uncharacterized protein n=1 Tax=Falsiroseomonas tokyonensis TaxID=430521 RepID=A0ABV7BPV7_9PROT|nr:hypothetical protein [Falsiroseomonas tokyonensis]MBU8536606.1 hypothetical protein [Falsiroseomonas tokyonensis]